MTFGLTCSRSPKKKSRLSVRGLRAWVLCGGALFLSGCGVTRGPDYSLPLVWLNQYGASQLGTSAETLGYGPEAATSVAVDGAGNVLVGGYVVGSFAGDTGSSSVANAYLAKYDSNGRQLWLREFAGSGGTLITGVAADAAGNIVAVGENYTGTSQTQIFAIKADPSGNPLWVQTVPVSGASDFSQQVKVEADGSAVVAGVGLFGGGVATVFAVRLAASNGNALWLAYGQVPGVFLLNGMTLDSSGDPVVVGAYLPSNTASPAAYALKLNQANGAALWLQQLSTTGSATVPFAVTTDSAGDALIAGGAYYGKVVYGFTADPQEKAILYKLNGADGTEAWKKTYSTGKGDSMTGIEAAPDGNLYAVGYTNGHYSPYDVRSAATVSLLVLDAGGTQKAARQFGTGPLTNTTVPYGPRTALDANGDLIVSGATTGAYPGFTNAGNDLQMFVAKLAPATLVK